MDGALRCSGGAAGEVQQGRVVGGGGFRRRVVVRGCHQLPEAERAGQLIARALGVHHQNVAHRRESFADLGDLAPVDRRRGHQHIGLADLHSGGDRLRAECREQGRNHAAVAQRAQHRYVQLGDAAHDGEHAVTLVDAEPA